MARAIAAHAIFALRSPPLLRSDSQRLCCSLAATSLLCSEPLGRRCRRPSDRHRRLRRLGKLNLDDTRPPNPTVAVEMSFVRSAVRCVEGPSGGNGARSLAGVARVYSALLRRRSSVPGSAVGDRRATQEGMTHDLWNALTIHSAPPDICVIQLLPLPPNLHSYTPAGISQTHEQRQPPRRATTASL